MTTDQNADVWLAGRDAAVAKLRSMGELYRAYSQRKHITEQHSREMWNHGETLFDAARAIESDVKPGGS